MTITTDVQTAPMAQPPSSFSKSQRTQATIAYYLAFVGLGLVSSALGPTIELLAQQTQSSLSQISYLFTVQSLGFMLGAVFVGQLYDRIAGHPILFWMMVGMAALFCLVPFAAGLGLLILLFGLIGFGKGSADVGGNTLLLWVHGTQVGPYMNGLHFIWGAGAFLSPIVIAWVMEWNGSLLWAYWALAALVMLTPWWLLRLPSSRSTES